MKNSYKNRLKEAILGEDTMNYARFEGKGLDVDELIRLADTMPFFAERRLIVMENCGLFWWRTADFSKALLRLW